MEGQREREREREREKRVRLAQAQANFPEGAKGHNWFPTRLKMDSKLASVC